MKRLLIFLHNQQQRCMNDGKDDGIDVERHLKCFFETPFNVWSSIGFQVFWVHLDALWCDQSQKCLLRSFKCLLAYVWIMNKRYLGWSSITNWEFFKINQILEIRFSYANFSKWLQMETFWCTRYGLSPIFFSLICSLVLKILNQIQKGSWNVQWII
jgi:hypothetical protein